jgi:tetratricopeptide (TPR) repeat protein
MAQLNGNEENNEQALAAGATENSGVPDGIRAFDQNGQEVIIPREEWRQNVLPGMLREVWDQPDNLYMLIVNSLNDSFVAEVTEAAAHLHEIDTIPARGACIWAVVLMQGGRLDEAEEVLNGHIAKHGVDGSVLVNLAKIYSMRDENERAEETLWRGLEAEPNQENGLGWFVSMAQERGGEEAAKATLERVRTLDGSWRAQLWLARGVLVGGNLAGAKELYTEALGRVGRPVPPDLLMQMSGDLGGQGHLAELVELTTPHFVPEMHGLPIGNNLIKANVDLGNLDAADAVKNALAAFQRPEWAQALGFWDGEIAKRRGGAAPDSQQGQIQIGMLRVDGPIWLPPGSPARVVFGTKPAGPMVTFLGGTAEAPEQGSEVAPQLADALGRMTRALPLYLAEQVEMRTAATGRAMIPWASGTGPNQPSGFVVSGARWPDEVAMQAVQDPANRSEYVVTVHVDAEVTPWEASLVFVRASDGTRIGELQAEFAPDSPEEGLPGLADEVVELLNALGSVPVPAAYVVPEPFGAYLLRLEQLLAVRCAGMDGVALHFLQGEREILEGDLALCHGAPENVPARVLLVETMGALARVRPEVVQGFQESFVQLQKEHPVAALDAAFGVAQG